MSFHGWFELIASGLITGGIYALIALGLNLQYGLMRVLNIAHGEFLMLGVLAIATIWMGVYPAPFTDLTQTSVADLLRHVAISKIPQ